jgi:D-glycero-beta-D-manno-heptose 1-phosphate adenylyltransferase
MTGDAMQNYWMTAYRQKVIAPEEVEAVVAKLRQQGKTIATLNGSFDLMHAGHLHMIYEASKQADVLIVALNTDRSIQQYKSPLRPIVPLEYRLQMMAALGFVGYVSYFDELDPCLFLEKVKPDVHVNGAEYGEKCIEADVVRKHGGRLKIVELIPGLSTSQLLAKVKQTCV